MAELKTKKNQGNVEEFIDSIGDEAILNDIDRGALKDLVARSVEYFKKDYWKN